jgi:hypothetical protein
MERCKIDRQFFRLCPRVMTFATPSPFKDECLPLKVNFTPRGDFLSLRALLTLMGKVCLILVTSFPRPNPTIKSCNVSAVKIYKATGSQKHKNIFFYFEKNAPAGAVVENSDAVGLAHGHFNLYINIIEINNFN